jgi:hypothetical protein
VQFLNELQRSEELKHQSITPTGLDPYMAMLRSWQSNRLRRTYTDLLADPRYTPACEFFLSDLYAPRDFSQRDHDLERIHGVLSRLLPAQAILLLTETVELNSMTHALDQRLLRVLVDQLSVTEEVTPALYAEAYRICDNYQERVRQIDLTQSLLMQVGEIAHLKVVGGVLKLAKIPAQRAGWVDLYDFLDRGRRAFMQMKDVKTFVDTIAQREMKLLDLMYAGDLQGFELLAGFSENLLGSSSADTQV